MKRGLSIVVLAFILAVAMLIALHPTIAQSAIEYATGASPEKKSNSSTLTPEQQAKIDWLNKIDAPVATSAPSKTTNAPSTKIEPLPVKSVDDPSIKTARQQRIEQLIIQINALTAELNELLAQE